MNIKNIRMALTIFTLVIGIAVFVLGELNTNIFLIVIGVLVVVIRLIILLMMRKSYAANRFKGISSSVSVGFT